MADEENFEDEGVVQERMQVYRKKHNGKKLIDLVKALAETRKRLDDAKAELKLINAEHDVLRFELVPDRMETDGVENVRYEGIGLVTTTADLRLATPGPLKPQLFAWFRANGCEDLVQESVNGSTLKSWVKGRIKKGLPYPDELMKVTPITRASITKKG